MSQAEEAEDADPTSGASLESESGQESAAFTIKKAEGIPAPKSALANPVPSRRSPKHVAFDEEAREADEPAAAASQGDRLLTGVSLSSYGLNSLTADRSVDASQADTELLSLKKTIRRLTAELSCLLTSRPSGGEDEEELHRFLPAKGPVPPWLCDTRVLAPLLVAAERRIESAGLQSARMEAKISELEQRAEEILRENERLRLKLRDSHSGLGSSQTEWQAVTEQARLVLEENQLMIHQLSLQQERNKQARKSHATESSRLRSRVEELETENADAKDELERVRSKLQDLKRKYQSAVMDREDEDLETVDRVKSLTRELHAAREQHKQAADELLHQLQAAEREKLRLSGLLSDAAADNEKLKLEVLGLKNSLQSKHRDNLLLQKFAKKHSSLQQYLDSVVTAANNLQSERDSYKEALEMQEKEFGHLIGQLVDELKVHSLMNDSKLESLDGAGKLDRIVRRLLQLLKDSESRREEADEQVQYLQSLLKQKQQQLDRAESENHNMEQQLESALNHAVAQ